jgi:hypothetical protein
VTALRCILRYLAGGVMLAPPLVDGHGVEFISARLRIVDEAVELRLTADYGGNPMLADESAARAVLPEVLQVEHDGRCLRLSELAPLQMERSSQWDEALPVSLSPAPDGLAHQLLVGIWRWQADAAIKELRFVVPNTSIYDVLLWKQEAGEEVKTMLLIAGDRTPAISLTHKSQLGLAWIMAAVGIVLLGWSFHRRMAARL